MQDELTTKLPTIEDKLSDEAVLSHFDVNPTFKSFRLQWSRQETELFCKLARAAHNAGLDWWHMSKGRAAVRFGRKNPGSDRAVAVLGVVRGVRERSLRWRRPVGPFALRKSMPITEELVTQVETILQSEGEALEQFFGQRARRDALWPDQLGVDRGDEDADEEDSADAVNDASELAVGRATNIIYYGPPGTGKTYTINQHLRREYIQDIPQGEDAAGMNRQMVLDQLVSRNWWEVIAAALIELDRPARVGDIAKHPFVKAMIAASGSQANIHPRIWSALNPHAVADSITVKEDRRMAPAVFDKSPDSEWRLAGDWRDHCGELIELVKNFKDGDAKSSSERKPAHAERFSFVTFHQSYGYEDFVEGLRPVLNTAAQGGDVRYEIRDGAFKKLCQRARVSPNQRFAMVIDEINRGNISKIFGELITLIEPDKREGLPGAVAVTLPYSGDLFSVPPNVDIIGSMNTADRSLALLDTALRRRFEFLAVMPDTRDTEGSPLGQLRVETSDRIINIPRMLATINERIEALYDRDHSIGHAYFESLKSAIKENDDPFKELTNIFRNRILPLLEEYFFEDWNKIRLVLADNQKPSTAQFIVESGNPDGSLRRLFGANHGLDTDLGRARYSVNEKAFANPDAYIGIYASGQF